MSRSGQNFAGDSEQVVMVCDEQTLPYARQSSLLRDSIGGPAAAHVTRVYLSDSNTFAGLAVDHYQEKTC